MEAVVAAIQEIGPKGDKRVIQPLICHMADAMTRILRRKISRRHPNEGRDMIDEAHGKLMGAVFAPASADGAGLREAFVARVEFRAADAIRKASLHRSRYSSSDEEGVVPQSLAPRTASAEEAVYVEELLQRITDERKRLAFRLHMEGVPFGSAKHFSIARALGVSAKTAGDWVGEVQEQMKLWLGDKQ
jgi:DNA-directed RNA polymerase specialized sigma24 family protein